MKIYVTVKPGAKRVFFKQASDGSTGLPQGQHSFVAAVAEPAIENRATYAVMELLAAHFGVPIAKIRLVSGRASRKKVFELIQ